MNRLARFMEDAPTCHMTFVAHVHESMVLPRTYLFADQKCEKILAHNQTGLVTGSYLRTYTQGAAGYGEQRGYKPVPLGALSVEITPNRKRVAVTQVTEYTHDPLAFCGGRA